MKGRALVVRSRHMRRICCLLVLAGCAHHAAPAPAIEGSGAPPAPAAPGPVRVLCDLPDRVITVDNQQVHVLARPSMKETSAPISNQDHLGDRCDGPGGGYAGCSMTYDRYWSEALGKGAFVENGTNEGNIVGTDSEDSAEDCRNDDPYGALATCSTASWFLQVRQDGDTFTGSLFVGDAVEGAELTGTRDGDGFTFAATATTPAVTLSASTLEVGGASEPCAVITRAGS
jgi:hypothetical protein